MSIEDAVGLYAPRPRGRTVGGGLGPRKVERGLESSDTESWFASMLSLLHGGGEWDSERNLLHCLGRCLCSLGFGRSSFSTCACLWRFLDACSRSPGRSCRSLCRRPDRSSSRLLPLRRSSLFLDFPPKPPNALAHLPAFSSLLRLFSLPSSTSSSLLRFPFRNSLNLALDSSSSLAFSAAL